jgi:hypothetical protein
MENRKKRWGSPYFASGYKDSLLSQQFLCFVAPLSLAAPCIFTLRCNLSCVLLRALAYAFQLMRSNAFNASTGATLL